MADEPRPVTPGTRSREVGSPSGFRADVEGLRAVAVGLVVLYHAGVSAVPGGFVGVDVFFVISGFLITGQMIKEVDQSGRLSLLGFYARRAKRILPAAAVVLVATAVAGRLVLSRVRWDALGGDVIAAATYVVNWRFADRAVDYLASDEEPSAVLHYWSLAVEEQFYILWPLLIIASLGLARVLAVRSIRPVLWLGLLLVGVPSFLWSLEQTSTNPDRAFFVTTTRIWELAIGAGVALLGPLVGRLPSDVARALGWSGLAGIGVAAVVINEHTAWPGYAAALPTVATAAVIVAGVSAGARGPVLLLGRPSFRWVGGLSYSWYLWHWPLLVMADEHWGGLSVAGGLAVVLASLLPAWLTHRALENPLRYSRLITRSPRLALSLGANFTLIGVCAGLLLQSASPAPTATDVLTSAAPGAAVLSATPTDGEVTVQDEVEFITPDPLVAATDLPDSSPDCFQGIPDEELITCTFGAPDGQLRVALVGDSKMDQWLPAFQVLARRYGWRLDVAFKGACPFMSAPAVRERGEEPYPECTEWNRSLLEWLRAEAPDFVITSQGQWLAADEAGRPSTDALVAGMHAAWRTVGEVGPQVIVLGNNGGPTVRNMMACVDENRTRLSACAFPRESLLSDPALLAQRRAVETFPGVRMVDMLDVICPSEQCPPVIGNVMVYRRGSHITATYAASTAAHLGRRLAEVGMPMG